jgi:hypothetical protein
VVAETLAACQRADPRRFGRYRINWSCYLRNCLGELARRANLGQDTSADLAVLRAGVGRLYPRTVWSRASRLPRQPSSLARRLRASLRWVRDHTPLKVLSPIHAGLRRAAARPAPIPTPVDLEVGFQWECFRPAITAPTPEEGFRLILEDQERRVPRAAVEAH